MTDESLSQVIARVRRAMPRNADVMRLCDELEAARGRIAGRDRAHYAEAPVVLAVGSNASNQSNRPQSNQSNGAFDKRAYQRDLMRRRRAAARQSKEA